MAILLSLALLGCVHRLELSDLSIRQIEQLSFDDAYRLWNEERSSLAGRRSRDGWHSIPAGATDSQTGEFTPSRIAALECRLGREAHLHEQFLRQHLAIDAEVHRILEASPRLCGEFGVESKAQVVSLAQGHYSHQTTDGWIPQVRQSLWLEALNRVNSQQDGPENGRGPIGLRANTTPSAASSSP